MTLVVIAIRVLPQPRWAALIYMDIRLKALNPMTMRQYGTAIGSVSGFAPNKSRIGSAKITHILQRDKRSVKERIKSIWRSITGKGKILFSSLFGKKAEKMDKVVSFLAILELIRDNKVTVEQDRNFGEISIEEKKG